MKHALEKAEELCSQVNEGVREKENSDRLEWIQGHVQCEGLSEVAAFGAGTRASLPLSLSGEKDREPSSPGYSLFCLQLPLPCS